MSETILQFFLDMLNCALGVFGGFVFALILQKRTDKKAKKERLKLITSNISEELNDIASAVEQYTALKKCLNCRIQTPSWDSILNSGIVLELIEEPVYTNIIKVYSLIKSFNEDRHTQTETQNMNDLNEIIRIAKQITASISFGQANQ